MPDTVSSTRYVEFDAPYLTRAMRLAGLTSTQISVVNAHGSDAAQLADAQGTYKLAGRPAGTWTPSVALTEFEQAYTANPHINAVLMPNDENGAPVITYLKSKGVKADTLPITGQDATLTGLGNVLTGYQCGTRVQAHLRRGSGRGGAGRLPASRDDTAAHIGQRPDQGHNEQQRRCLDIADPGVGHHGQHGLNGYG